MVSGSMFCYAVLDALLGPDINLILSFICLLYICSWFSQRSCGSLMLRSQMSSLRQVMRQMLAYVLDRKEKSVRVCKLHFECFENVV